MNGSAGTLPRKDRSRAWISTVTETRDPLAEIEIVREVERELAVRTDVERLLAQPAAAFRPRERDERLNRAMNVVIALAALVVAAPVMLVVALLVKLTSPGPVFYTQERVGQDRRRGRAAPPGERRDQDFGGRLFTIYKFRSMRLDAERDGAVWAMKNDPRVTPIGGALRTLRLDELPQLFNVLKGDMNIVGPRPERPCIFGHLREEIREYPLRQLAKPGITGWAQVNHTYDTCVDDVRTKVRYDLEYLQQQSLWTDVKIMARTVPVMLFRKSGW
ncbi:MAG: sugar transferase [Gemmatimonadaceae bacterium]